MPLFKGAELRKDSRIRIIALWHGWRECWRKDKGIRFFRDTDYVFVDFSTMRVKTTITHPKSGRNELIRDGLTWEELEAVFENPRAHTGKGWRRWFPGKKS